ncbi:5-methyltetrahydropteroyltriglutamate--homocysteine S-methyltransferase [Planococcus kocurii]|uniref:5-methyltetrahydropteroyltriglutamate-- homocysteine S-methyltransferase n=1 Tax=Planococcus kocurii TaxID=1374 RepID=UPI003D0043C9
MTNTTKETAKTVEKAPFKADHVGSLLRPESIHQARKDFKDGKINAEQLREVETIEIKRIVDKQIEVGLKAVTDGEFRRTFWHTDFMAHINGFEGYAPEKGYQFKNIETEAYDVRNIGKISFNENHPFVSDFIEFKKIVAGRAIPKLTIPSPNQFFNQGIRDENLYPDLEVYAIDIIQTYRDAFKAFYEAGARYIQIDDVYIAGLSSPGIPFNDGQYSREYLIDLALRVTNAILEDQPEDLAVTTHLCRGNYQSDWAFEGSYALIAPTLFAKEKVNGFFLEYDDDRSGSFQPLEHIPANGPRVVLGIFTSKNGDLEDKESIKARITEATQYIPIEQICISPQCGFASTHHGNILTEQQQWDKLRYIVEISEEIFGE